MPTLTVRLSPNAEQDLESIADYVALHRSTEEALQLLADLLAKAVTLKEYPRRGAVPKEVELLDVGEVRQTLLLPYRVIYEIVGDVIVVTLTADRRRDMQTLLEQRLLGR